MLIKTNWKKRTITIEGGTLTLQEAINLVADLQSCIDILRPTLRQEAENKNRPFPEYIRAVVNRLGGMPCIIQTDWAGNVITVERQVSGDIRYSLNGRTVLGIAELVSNVPPQYTESADAQAQ